MKDPLVSVCIQTYQHVEFIEQCLQGVLNQQTDFDFEIILGEDESSDGTREICTRYAHQYPQKIRLFKHERKNVIYIDGKPSGRYNLMHNLSQARGKYIALCEGDDYWTDPKKLQTQVNILQKKPGYALSFHNIHDLNDDTLDLRFQQELKSEFTTHDFLDRAYAPTVSMVFRKDAIANLPPWFKTVFMGDWPLMILLSLHGNAHYLPDSMGVSRIGGTGVWSGSKKDFRLRGKYHMYKVLKGYLPIQYQKTVDDKLTSLYPSLILNSLKRGQFSRTLNYLKEFILAPLPSKMAYFKKFLR